MAGSKLMAMVAGCLVLGIALHLVTGRAWAALAPLAVVMWSLFVRHFTPEAAAERRNLVAFLRYSSVGFSIMFWNVAVGFLLTAALQALLPAIPTDLAWYAPFVLPVALALEAGGPVMGSLAKGLIAVLYDPPLHMVVVSASSVGTHPSKQCAAPQRAYATVGWRINSLMTPIGSGEILLGALPYEQDAFLLRNHGVTGVVNLCREWRGPVERYSRVGIQQFRIPCCDGDMPDLASVTKALEFLRAHVEAGGRVFVHCRCGMGRSATVVLCYLIEQGWSLEDAVAHLRRVRPEVSPAIKKYPTVLAVAAAHSAAKSRTISPLDEPILAEEATQAVFWEGSNGRSSSRRGRRA
jgi:protein-tyrosine phosphatase